jgi:hypothetical protein
MESLPPSSSSEDNNSSNLDNSLSGTSRPSFFKKHKGGIIAAIVVAVIILVGVLVFLPSKKDNSREYNQKYAKYIAAYTSGTVSKRSFIRVQLASQVKTMSDMGVADNRDLFSFSPSVKGKAFWVDAQTVEFRPDESLKAGEDYEVNFDLGKPRKDWKSLILYLG